MTQKIFDTDNADDMALLWSILPERITNLTPIDNFLYTPDNCIFTNGIIRIDFHDKREIIRPIPEATFDDVGKLCIFWEEKEINSFGILEEITSLNNELRFWKNNISYKHCRRLTKQEIEELC